MDFTAIHEAILSVPDLNAIVDFRFDVLENDIVSKYHGTKCPNMTKDTDFCDFIADGANLCAETHSKKWADFTLCMYSHAATDVAGDSTNPLASPYTFDVTVAQCAAKMDDYSVAELLACTHGDEGAALRATSVAKTPMSKFHGPDWVDVNGHNVTAPDDETASRDDWKKDVVKAVCDAYTGAKPASC